ncbi:sulfite reductase (NADPH) flavoprotein alpha-component [Rugamonas rubra]|uniref:Sulfite reductase (NADPH) flavoprotein alpha-component n=1 Tax=Rugamonas rubra TaxID=758825 RepID=A0A1I4M5X6_9BURK|nr:sulfite reductase (NADPH) flavoprotein alpha-component [Rugamonas rubra]
MMPSSVVATTTRKRPPHDQAPSPPLPHPVRAAGRRSAAQRRGRPWAGAVNARPQRRDGRNDAVGAPPPAGPTPPPARPRAARRPTLPLAPPGWRQLWFQLHWLVGITGGTLLMVIGLSGALLSFREECLDLLNPGVRQVAPRAEPVLAPAQVAAAVARVHGTRRISTMMLYAEPGAATRVIFAPLPGQRRGESIYVDPYSGTAQALRGHQAFEWIEALHRWLLLPRETGDPVTGTLALLLIGMAASGLYLRWPRRPLSWRTWLTFDPALRGRPFLWNLHAVLGTWVLPLYLVLAGTGLYWSFDIVRDSLESWAGRPPRAAMNHAAAKPAGKSADMPAEMAHATGTPTLALAWDSFLGKAPDWRMASLRISEKATQPVQISWLDAAAPHEQARNRMSVLAASGKITQDKRYADLNARDRFLTTFYPLHMGTYFGLPGRLAMMVAGLAMPLFGITGWMLYLGRRKLKRAARAERALLADADTAVAAPAGAAAASTLLAYASQSGSAERLALRSAAALRQAGVAATVQSLDRLAPSDLLGYARVLLVASSFGEGEPPDGTRRFARLLKQADPASLAGLRFGLLALGDRHYSDFCGFGRALDERLRALGAKQLFPAIEVDDGDAVALQRWSQSLAQLCGVDQLTGIADGAGAGAGKRTHGSADATNANPAGDPAGAWQTWPLVARTLLNPGSQGGPLYEVVLDGAGANWQAGALLEVLPRNPDGAVAAWLRQSGLDGHASVRLGSAVCSLHEALARSILPAPAVPTSSASAVPTSSASVAPTSSAQACADQLRPLAPRSYSLASLPQDGGLQLLVRQESHPGGLGLGSGWLTAHAPLDAPIQARLQANPGFAPAEADGPAIFIGNGSGFAGLRAHLRARALAGRRRNWLLFGEREQAYDSICADEIAQWQAAGLLPRLDLVFSRDGACREYVQDRLRGAADELRGWIADGAMVYVCGSLQGMAGGVDAALVEILGADALDDLAAAGRYRRDVY